MSDARRAQLRGRYLSLGLGELFAAAVFLAVALVSALPLFDGQEARALWAALVPLLVVLVQAGAYWLLARRWVDQGRMPRALARVYRGFRVLDAVLLVVGAAGLIAWLPSQPGLIALACFVWLFGVIEYVNYFIARLAYPASQWTRLVGQWRTPRLMQDVRAAG